jgi:alkylhydroperoxidase family enzyme
MATEERIQYPPASALPAGIPPANILRMWSHSSGTIKQSVALGVACITATSLPSHFRKLLFLFCAQKFQCEYMWVRHIDDAVDNPEDGLTKAQMAALEKKEWILDESIWSEDEQAFLNFVNEVIDSPTVSDAVFDAARKYFNEREIVEIITMQACILSILGSGMTADLSL